MLPTFIKSFLWGSEEEEQYSLANDEQEFITELTEDWLLISEQGESTIELLIHLIY